MTIVILVTDDDVANLRGRLTVEAFRAHLLGGGRGETAEDGVRWATSVVESWLMVAGARPEPSRTSSPQESIGSPGPSG